MEKGFVVRQIVQNGVEMWAVFGGEHMIPRSQRWSRGGAEVVVVAMRQLVRDIESAVYAEGT